LDDSRQGREHRSTITVQRGMTQRQQKGLSKRERRRVQGMERAKHLEQQSHLLRRGKMFRARWTAPGSLSRPWDVMPRRLSLRLHHAIRKRGQSPRLRKQHSLLLRNRQSHRWSQVLAALVREHNTSRQWRLSRGACPYTTARQMVTKGTHRQAPVRHPQPHLWSTFSSSQQALATGLTSDPRLS